MLFLRVFMADPALSLAQFVSHYDSKLFTRAQNK